MRYESAYLFGIEPRFKMRYGSYLAAPRWARVTLHMPGTVGSPLALGMVREWARPDLTVARALCAIAFGLIVALNLVSLLCGFAGIRRLGPLVNVGKQRRPGRYGAA